MRRQDLQVGEVYALGGQRNIHYAGILLGVKQWTPMSQRYQGATSDPVIARHGGPRVGNRSDKGSLFLVMRHTAASTEVELLRRWFVKNHDLLDTLDERPALRRSDHPADNGLYLHVEVSSNVRRTWAEQLKLWEAERQKRLELSRRKDEDLARKEALFASIEQRAKGLGLEPQSSWWDGTGNHVKISLEDFDVLLTQVADRRSG